jgi:aminopeptidase-like protein
MRRLPLIEPSVQDGQDMHDFMRSIQPYRRSITGEGLRQTLDAIAEHVPITVQSVPSGREVLDWRIPPEWVLREAYIAATSGRRVLELSDSPLRVVGYSTPIDRRMSREELLAHLHTLPDHPDWIPYRTSYYNPDWGFCLTQRELESLTDAEYDVCVDSDFLADGCLNYGELFLQGDIKDEVLVSCHCCHPAMANDNLSGIAVALAVAKRLIDVPHRYSYRFLFVPGTVGSIAWLAQNEHRLQSVRHGFVLAGVGDERPLTYKRSRLGGATIDRVFEYVLRAPARPDGVVDFEPYGYDERQYCSPGFDLAVGALMRAKHGTYAEYHTSADDLDFVKAVSLRDTLASCMQALFVLEGNMSYRNLLPKGEPQLGRRGLYGPIGGRNAPASTEMAMLWVLSYSDGDHDLLQISDRSGLSFHAVRAAADALEAAGLLVVSSH